MVIRSTHIRCAAAFAVGIAITTAHPLGIASAILMPALALSQPTRRSSYAAALSYYGAALWPMILGAKNFLGPDVSVIAALLLWSLSTAALASVWPLVWSSNRGQAVSRSTLGLLLTVLPPLGIIGFASPLTAAGFLFPRTAWCGLLACAFLSGALAASPRRAAAIVAFFAIIANALHFKDPDPIPGWQGIDTNFGAIAHGRVNPITEYQAAQWIQQFALSSSAKVIVFPETVVPTWTAATEAFWQQTLDRLRASGKTILVGARLPVGSGHQLQARYDFSADLVALRGGSYRPFPPIARFHLDHQGFPYDNTVLVRGAETREFLQHIPVPIGMWDPFRGDSARLHLFAPSVLPIGDERAAVLVCYEQILSWPVFTSVVYGPTIFVAVANDHWATGTPIPACQAVVLRAWSRLFGIPAVSATNR